MQLARQSFALPPDSSVLVFHHDAANPCPVLWHYHPEIELVYLPQGSGRRHIGRTVSRYEAGELLLLGPNVPHLSYGYGQDHTFEEVGALFSPQLIDSAPGAWPELGPVRALLARAATGLVFAAPVRHAVGPQVQRLRTLPPWERLLSLLDILQQLALCPESAYTALAAGPPVTASPVAQERLNRVLTLLHQRLSGSVSVPELAAEAALSVPAFCRFFKHLTQRTVTEFVNECRVQLACQLLRGSDSITEVAHASGFHNLSYFNRTFRRLMSMSPSAYRRTMTGPGILTP
jgi:AraC-like DNA-binding protein/quercetin dioxygenase-like cupin family protein